jgi:hypothetical protein
MRYFDCVNAFIPPTGRISFSTLNRRENPEPLLLV